MIGVSQNGINFYEGEFIVKIIVMSVLVGLSLCVGLQSKSVMAAASRQSAVVKAPAAAKPAIPATGKAYTLGQLFALINTSNPANSSNFILPTLGGQVVKHDQCWPSQGNLVEGSVSAGRVNFGGVVINQAWVAANANLQVQLQADPALIAFLVRDKRLQQAGGIDQQYAQILLFFVLAIGGVNYRFYLNDTCPGRINGKVYPARAIIKKWDLQRSYNP